MSFGIALAGGGVRGAAHVGVLRALHENNLFPSSIAGTSAGGIIAGFYASGISPTEMSRMVVSMSKTGCLLIDPDYAGILKAVLQFFTRRPISLSGLIKGDRMERYFEKLTQGKSFRDIQMPTVIPAVDLSSGKTVSFANLTPKNKAADVLWATDVPLSEAMRASMAVPTVFRPKQIQDLYLVDGGVTDVLPVNLLLDAGERNVLAVDLSTPYEPPENQTILEIVSRTLSIMSNRLKDCASIGEKLLLTPSLPEEIGLLTFGKMEECMEIGYETTVRMLPTIKSLFR